jgi:membrane dipeptidase
MIGLNANKHFSGFDQGGDPIEAMGAQLDYMVHVVGTNHIGYGFDLMDCYNRALPRLKQDIVLSDAFSDYSQVPLLTASLLEKGYEEADVIKMIGGNWIRYFMDMLPE